MTNNTDRVLDQIDDVLAGYGGVDDDLSVSPDAMRWAPEQGMRPRRPVPIHGADRLLYVEITEWVSGYLLERPYGEVGALKRRHAKSLARMLHVKPVASGWRIMAADTDPFPLQERGYERVPAYTPPDCQLAQGYALARWEPFWYPPDGNWRGWNLSTGMPGLGGDWSLWPGTPPRQLTDPLDDLQTWVGAATEKLYVTRLTAELPYAVPWDLLLGPLTYRRDAQADGKPLWTTDKLLPPALRGRNPAAFVCHATATHLIPAPNLDMPHPMRS